MIYSIIHLSDLHYQPNWDEENDLVCGYLLKDIKNITANLPNRYVFFTGDLVYSADDPNGYSGFISKITTKLDEMGITKQNRVCIPGNHDVEQSALKGKVHLQNGAVNATMTETGFNSSLKELENHYFAAKFANYQKCERGFAEYGCCSTNLAGSGWSLPGGLGIYCLNTAIACSAALKDQNGEVIDDKGKLPIATRHLHQWIATDESSFRILLAHHPGSWLNDWASKELARVVNSDFQLVLTGHEHTVGSHSLTKAVKYTVFCEAPALFTRKDAELGYSIIRVDTETGHISVQYRQWVNQHRCFVPGTAMAGEDNGCVEYSGKRTQEGVTVSEQATQPISAPIAAPVGQAVPPVAEKRKTKQILEEELSDSLRNYSSKPLMWVERDIATFAETSKDGSTEVMLTPAVLAKSLRDCIIRAPREFGLSCVGRKIACEHFTTDISKSICLYISASKIDVHRRGVETAIEKRVVELEAEECTLGGIIIDDWTRDKKGRKLLGLLRELFPETVVILLETIDVGAVIEQLSDTLPFSHGDSLYLWSLSQNRIRALVNEYVADLSSLDAEVVTRKIIKDIDALNIFRTPTNCLMFLRLAEQAFDDSPVNRTELIYRVLFLLFYRFDEIPTYASRPDLKDCEYVLGNFCESLVREGKSEFTKHQFYTKSLAYCESQFVGVDVDILFAFVVSARIIVFNGGSFQFRFTYWLHYFAAHRMHHSPEFAKFILSEQRYASMPEIIEFYTGIDRRRSDAVQVIANDLSQMTLTVSERTGIPLTFDPFAHAKWKPSKEDVDALQKEITASIVRSPLPAEMRDALADRSYDKARPYSQQVNQFVERATLSQMFYATRGAARALRNSDHVPPNEKINLLNAVMNSLNRVAQVITFISPVLVAQSKAHCEGLSFALSSEFDNLTTPMARWVAIMQAIPTNILAWFEDDLYSSKLGPLVKKHIADNPGSFAEILLMLILIRQRPEGWAKDVKQFILRASSDSMGLLEIFQQLRMQKRVGFITDADEQQINHLSAFSLAKHHRESESPNRDEIRNAARALGDPLPPSSSELRHSKGLDRKK